MSPARTRISVIERRRDIVLPPTSVQYPFGGSTNALFKPIPGGTPVHPDSQKILQNCGWLPVNTSYTWLLPAYRAAMYFGDLSANPLASVYVNWPNVCATVPKYTDVPFPSNWADIVNSQGTDHITILCDPNTGDYQEGWRVSGPGFPSLHAAGGPAAGACSSSRWNSAIFQEFHNVAFNPTASGGNGVFPSSSGVSASDIMVANGLCYPWDFDDLSEGSFMPHAISFDSHCQSNANSIYPRFVAPARAGDGHMDLGFPAGCRLRLKPSYDYHSVIDSRFPLQPANAAFKKVCKTFQVMGLVPVDSSNAEGVGAWNVINTSAVNRWPGYSTYKWPWEQASSNYGSNNYRAGFPIEMMNPANWDILDWNVFTGA